MTRFRVDFAPASLLSVMVDAPRGDHGAAMTLGGAALGVPLDASWTYGVTATPEGHAQFKEIEPSRCYSAVLTPHEGVPEYLTDIVVEGADSIDRLCAANALALRRAGRPEDAYRGVEVAEVAAFDPRQRYLSLQVG